MWGAEGRGWGQSSSIHSSPMHNPRLHCAQATGDIPKPGVLAVSALLSLRNFKMRSLPLLSLTMTNCSPKPCSPGEVGTRAVHSDETPPFLTWSRWVW